MNINYCKGYTVYQENNRYVFVSPHSGPALEVGTSRDNNSETIASLCWQRLRGKLVIAGISRKRLWGIDFNRDIPSEQKAVQFFNDFKEDEKTDSLYDYRTKFAWVALDRKDHNHRLEIYNGFWNEIKQGQYIILMHRAFTRMKAVPSIMDLTTFSSKGIDKKKLIKIIDEINAKHKPFFKEITEEYKSMIYYEEKRVLSNIKRIYKKLDPNLVKAEFAANLKKDLAAVKKYAHRDVWEELEAGFSEERFLKAVKNALDHIPIPRVTVEEIFNGELALGPKKQLFPTKDKTIIQFEPTSFLSMRYPNVGADIVCEIIEKLDPLYAGKIKWRCSENPRSSASV